MTIVSILMNGYNSQKYLKEAIDSVYAQTCTKWEIIFVDNCSTDDTAEIVKGYDERIKYYKTEKNLPLGEARNIGLKHCNGDFVGFLDTDDIWLPEKLALQLAQFEADPTLKMSYTGAVFINETGAKIGGSVPVAGNGNVFPQLLVCYEINMQSVLIKNDIEVLFDPTKKYAEDFDLFVKISAVHPVGVLKQKLIKYRKHAANLSHACKDIEWSEQNDILNDIFATHPYLKDKYPKQIELAYARVAYYKARYLVDHDQKREARNALKKYRWIKPFYFCLYALLFLPATVWQKIHTRLRVFS